MNRYWRLMLLVIMLIALLGSFTMRVSANSKAESSWDYSEKWAPYTCANGQILVEEYTLHADDAYFYTKDGEFFMLQEQVTQTGKEYLQNEPDKVIYYENEHWTNFIKPDGSNWGTGIIMKITIPGYGMVFQDIGRVVFEYDPVAGHYVPIFFAGQHQWFDPDQFPYNWNYSAPCQYLTSLP